MAELRSDAKKLLKRMEKTLRKPRFNRQRARRAVQKHSRHLGFTVPAVEVVDDLDSGVQRAHTLSVDRNVYGHALAKIGMVVKDARNLAVPTWTAGIALNMQRREQVERITPDQDPHWSAVWYHVGRCNRLEGATTESRTSLQVMDVGIRMFHNATLELAAYINTVHDRDERIARPWMALLEALEAGIGWLFPMDEAWVLVPLPQKAHFDEADQLHRADGPAVRWRSGRRFYFYHGVEVPAKVVLDPDSLTPEEILAERNAEVRRVMIERFGRERLVRESTRCEVLDESDTGRLCRITLPREVDGEDLFMLEVNDPSSEQSYMLRVPPEMERVEQARAWTFHMDESEFNPIDET